MRTDDGHVERGGLSVERGSLSMVGRHATWRALLLVSLLFTAGCEGRTAAAETPDDRVLAAARAVARPVAKAADSTFATLVGRLSEPGGYFDTDNLISNEASYLHVMGALRERGVQGGAFIGVGPDQSFSYIAQIRPSIAFMVDIRRDNLLQHLMFKALFQLSDTRIEYLSLLFGKAAPAEARAWTERSIEELVAAVESAPVVAEEEEAVRSAVMEAVVGFGVPLDERDLEMINFIHASFVRAGVRLEFTSHNRGANRGYPSYQELLFATDLTGRQANYLVREEDYRFLRSMQERGLIVPVVGNLAGDHALAEIGRVVAERGEVVSAFYTSNVEFYLMGDGTFPRFAATTSALPRNERSVIIRSVFRRRLPQSVPGYMSTQLLQPLDRFAAEYAAGGFRSYMDVVTKGALELR